MPAGRKKKTSANAKDAALPPCKADGASGLEQLGELSKMLGGVIGAAFEDKDQFKRYILSEKVKDEAGDLVSENVERVFEKVDFKSVKEAAGALKALADTVKSVYSISDGASGGTDHGGIKVVFENGEDYAL